ncbi:MAG: DUF2169 domain-containing protein [Polyangiaceae bacterium]
MDVLSVCPLRVASLLWRAGAGAWGLTCVCKATYLLESGVSPLAPEQEDPNDDDNHWDDDPAKSLYAPADLIPYKPRAEVLLVGYAFAPPGSSVSSIRVRLRVGEVDKSIAVYGERSWTLDGRLREPAPFARMPLRYERAGGGPDTANPVGMRPDTANGFGEVAVPNLWPVDRMPQRRGEIVPPVAFGPIAESWPGRRDRLGPRARAFTARAALRAPIPPDVDPTFFSAAPPDQQLTELRADEPLLLEGLHPHHPRLTTRLPGVAPRAFVERSGSSAQELTLRADTLWIDTDRGIVTLVWRAQIGLVSETEPGRVLIGMERPGQKLTWADLARAAGAPRDRGSFSAMRGFDRPSAPLLDWNDGAPPKVPETLDEVESLSDDDVRETTESLVALTDRPSGEAAADATSTLFLMGAPDPGQTMPFAALEAVESRDPLRKAEQAAAAIKGQDLPVGWAPPSPFSGEAPQLPGTAMETAFLPPVSAPAPAEPTAPFISATPPGPPGLPAPAPPPLAPPPLAPPSFQDLGSALVRPEPVREVAVAGALARATEAGEGAARLGVLGMSEAAAEAHRVVERDRISAVPEVEEPILPVRQRPSEILKLLWFDPKVLPRLHKHPEWRILLAEMELRLLDDFDREGAEDEDKKARRSVFEVLSRGIATPPEGLRRTLDGAVDEDGAFEPPLVLLSGEMELPFDEMETLKATVTLLTPLFAPLAAADNKKPKELLDAASQFLTTPGSDQFAHLAQGHIDRLRDAFSQIRRSLPADYVDSHTERALLRQRAYSMKTLYGKRWIRGLLKGAAGVPKSGDSPGRAASSEMVPPVYLPEALREELPAYKRIRIKALGEVDLQEDQEESASWVVKIVALSRVLSGI